MSEEDKLKTPEVGSTGRIPMPSYRDSLEGGHASRWDTT
jgi:hypothetical protein